jgi:hypothetical protein
MHKRDYPRYERQQQLEEDTSHLIEYRLERSTRFYDYVILVRIDKARRKQYVLVFDCEPVITGMFGLIKVNALPVKQATLGALADVNSEIARMIVDNELMLYSKEIAENVDTTYLELDYANEIHKRRARAASATTTETTTVEHNYEAPTINDYFDTEQEPKKTPEQIKAEQIQEIADRAGRTVAQVSNLAQFREKKQA